MLRLQLPERSSFRFGRKSYIEDKENAHTLDELDTNLELPPHIPLSLVHHTSTKSLFDLFQSHDGSAYGLQTFKNETKVILNPVGAKSDPEDLDTPALESSTVSPLDAQGSHRDPNAMSPRPSAFLPTRTGENEDSAASTPSSRFRDDDDASGCTRKSSTSSIGTPLAGHQAYFDAVAALDRKSAFAETPNSDTQQPNAPEGLGISRRKTAPQYDKPLPPPPSQEPLFSVSSVISIMRAESSPNTGRKPSMRIVAEAPMIFHRQSKISPSHARSVSDSVLRSKASTSLKVKSPTTSPRSKRGARLGSAMSQGHSHSRSQTESNIAFLPPGAERPERPRPLSGALHRTRNRTISEDQSTFVGKLYKKPATSVSPTAAEKVIFEIMKRLDEPADLLATAAVNRGFRDTFKRGEPRLVHDLLRRRCPAAWEFQKNSAQASGELLSLRNYTRDKAVVTFIKSALLESCSSVLQPETLPGLTGADVIRQSRIDAALWRIWTFCKGFGHRSLSEDDTPIQVDWLNGGRIARKRQMKTAVGRGNGKGLSVPHLEDLLELWDSLGAMLSRFGSNVVEARVAGIFQSCNVDENHTEEWFLQEWTYHIRSLGLTAVSLVSSATSFEQIKAAGFTVWTPPLHGQTRAGFFRAAVSSVYQERILAEAATKATQFALPPRSQHRPSASDASIGSLEQLTRALERRAAQQQNLKINTSPVQVRRKPLEPSPVVETSKPNTTWQPETPDTPYPPERSEPKQVDAESNQNETKPDTQRDTLRDSLVSPIRNSVVLQSLGMTSTASTRLGATLFPMEYPPTSPQIPVRSPTTPAQSFQSLPHRSIPPPDDPPAVIDPVDKAMQLLTRDMGFTVAEASRALAKCDTGFGLDVQKAIEMLARESGRTLVASSAPQPGTPTLSDPVNNSAPTSPGIARVTRDTCTGHHEYEYNNTSNVSSKIVRSFEPLCDTHPVRQPSLLGNLNRNSLKSLTRMTSRAKAYKVLGMERLDKSSRAVDTEDGRPPRVTSLKAISSNVNRPWQPLPAEQRPQLKMPSRKAKDDNTSRLKGIDEEPSFKAMEILGVEDVDIIDGRISPAASYASKAKSKPAKRFYEGRFGNLGWSDSALVK
jgi:hypothetical protein